MLSVLDDPAIRAHAHAISVTAYHALVDSGMLGSNIELLRGALVEKMPKSPLHTSILLRLVRFLPLQIPAEYSLRAEQPLTFLDSEPEPDIAIVAGTIDDYERAHPRTAAIVIEVVVSTEALDRKKLQIYAEAGVRECWLILAEQRLLERHTDPAGTTYRHIERCAFPETLPSTIFPGLALPPAALFPG